jgi:hypothetical protein
MQNLNKNYRLRHGNFEPPATAQILTSEHVIDADHIISRFLESRFIHFVCSARWLGFACSLEPTYIVFSSFAAMRATKCRLLHFFSLVKKISLVHKLISNLRLPHLRTAPEDIGNYRYRSGVHRSIGNLMHICRPS